MAGCPPSVARHSTAQATEPWSDDRRRSAGRDNGRRFAAPDDLVAHLAQGGLERHAQDRLCARSWAIHEFERSPVASSRGVRDRQAEPNPLAHALRGEERLEDAVPYPARNA